MSDEVKKGVGDIADWLNHLEVVAIAIGNRSLHRATYVKWQGEALKEYWLLAKPLVIAMRSTDRGSEDLFENIEAFLAEFP